MNAYWHSTTRTLLVGTCILGMMLVLGACTQTSEQSQNGDLATDQNQVVPAENVEPEDEQLPSPDMEVVTQQPVPASVQEDVNALDRMIEAVDEQLYDPGVLEEDVVGL